MERKVLDAMTTAIINHDSRSILTPVLSAPLLPALPQRFYDYKAVANKRVEADRANHIWQAK